VAEDVTSSDVLIIGAGLAGIMAGRVLQEAGIEVVLIDKGRSVGGRMATRRIGPGRADHGAQFFTVRTPEFQRYVDEWLEEGLAYIWSYGFSDGSLAAPSVDEGYPRHAIRGGVNALMKHLAEDLNVMLETEIFTATCDDEGWILQDQDGNLFVGNALLMTSPVPQSLKILDMGATVLTRDDEAALRAIEYDPCLTGIFWVDGLVRLPPPGAVQRRNDNISWIGDNHQKGISPDARIITMQASGKYSAQMWSAPDDRILNALRTSLQIYMDDDAVIREAQLKRWRYSEPTTTYEDRYLLADNSPLLMFAGDAFGGPRVEGAVLSGLAAGQALIAAANG